MHPYKTAKKKKKIYIQFCVLLGRKTIEFEPNVKKLSTTLSTYFSTAISEAHLTWASSAVEKAKMTNGDK